MPKFGKGIEHAVTYSFPLESRSITIKRYLANIDDLKLSPNNPRIKTKLEQEGCKNPTEEKIESILWTAAEEMIAGFLFTRGVNNPCIIRSNKEILDGNTRTLSHRILVREHGETDFQYITVEELPADITEREIDTLLAIKHCRPEKSWPSRERATVIQRLIEKDGLLPEQVADLMDRPVKWVRDFIQTGTYYKEFDRYTKKRSTATKVRDVNPDNFHTYLWKVASSKKLNDKFQADKGFRNQFYGWVKDGKFNDCLNIDKFRTIICNYPELASKLDEQGARFEDVVKAYEKVGELRRGQEFWPELRRMTKGLLRLSSHEKHNLTTAPRKDDYNALVTLQETLQSLLGDLDEEYQEAA